MVLHAQQKPAMMQSVADSQFGELAGLAATTTPTKPTAQAIHRPAPTFSFSTKIERTMTMMGAENCAAHKGICGTS